MKLEPRPWNLGLTGWPLAHSLSPRLHTAALRALGLEGQYRLYPVPPGDPDALAGLLAEVRSGRLHGLNVTIPHKRALLEGMEVLTPTARATGAVNTISCEAGKLVGENTDVGGFRADLHARLPQGFAGGEALVLGAGGSARAVVYALLLDGWAVRVAARRVEPAEALVCDLSAHLPSGPGRLLGSAGLDPHSLAGLAGVSLVVNCTPLGMSPQVQASPWPLGLPLPPRAFVYDLVYQPAETLLLRSARESGLPAANGRGMLAEQAALAFERWTGRPAPRRAMGAALDAREAGR
jgi:shikimate dehydrogenase